MKTRLFTPGPTPVPEHVALRMAAPLPHHRTEEFRAILRRVHTNLQHVFLTDGPVLPLTCSGTGAMEAAMVNLFSPGDRVLTVNGGKFGERWTTLAKTFGMVPEELTVPWGTAVTADAIGTALRRTPAIRGVLLAHSETSTGAAVDLRAIAGMVRSFPDVLLVVDAITSLGAHELRCGAWGIDACVAGSQKGLMIPPGLGFVSLSSRAVEAVERSTTPRMYFDLRRALKAHASHDTPWTPAITLFLGLDEALEMILAEGLEAVWARHERHTRAVRAGVAALGLRLFSDAPSHAVTTVWLPEGIPWKDLQGTLRKQCGMIIAGGQGEFAGRIFRLSHLGYYDDLDIITMLAGLERALALLGHGGTPGAGITAAQQVLAAA